MMTGPDCAVTCNLINIYTYIHTWGRGRSGNGNGGGNERRSAGRERGRERRWGPVDEHRMGTGMGTGTEARTVAEMGRGTEARAVAEMGTGTRITGTGTRIGSGRADERLNSARNRKIVVDVVRETGETRVEREKNLEKKGLVQ